MYFLRQGFLPHHSWSPGRSAQRGGEVDGLGRETAPQAGAAPQRGEAARRRRGRGAGVLLPLWLPEGEQEGLGAGRADAAPVAPPVRPARPPLRA